MQKLNSSATTASRNPLQFASFMAMGQATLLFLFVTFTCLSLSLGSNCPKIKKDEYTDETDKVIFYCCLGEYRTAYTNLPENTPVTDRYPPSCQVDTELGKCLTESNSYGDYTNSLRLLILSQLVFLKTLKVCPEHEYEDLKREALARKLPYIKDIIQIENIHNPKECASKVSAECGKRFKDELKKHPDQICEIFIREGGCLAERGTAVGCHSQILEKYAEVSYNVAPGVLTKLCSPILPKP